MSFTRVTANVDSVLAEHHNQLVRALEGDAGSGQPFTLTALSDAARYALSVANQDATGLALQVYKPDLIAKWLDITAAGSLIDGLQVVQGTPSSAPGVGKTAIFGTSASDLWIRPGAGLASQVLVANFLTAQGDVPYASAAGVLGRLALPTKGYAYLAGSSAPLGDPIARKNYVINGSFRIWQRGTSAPTVADNAYGPDRWRCLTETTSTGFTINREATDVPSGGSRYAAKLAVGASNNVKSGLFTILEGADVWDLRGQAVSLQVALKVSDARIGDVRMALVQWTGTEDAVSADPISAWGAAGTNPSASGSWANVNTPANLNPTTSWATYKLENQAISASATNLAVFIWIDDKTTTAGDYLLVTDVQLERGAVCTAVERPPLAQALMQCQRYYEVIGGTSINEVAGAGECFSTTLAVISVTMRPKRVAPTISVSAAADWQVLTAGTTIACTALTGAAIGLQSFQASAAVAAGLTVGDGAVLRANGTATTRLSMDSEL